MYIGRLPHIYIMIAERFLSHQIGHRRLKVSGHRLTDGCQVRLDDWIFPALQILSDGVKLIKTLSLKDDNFLNTGK